MSTRPLLQPDAFTIGGPRLAYDARPRLKPGGRDADPSDPKSALLAWFDSAMGEDHPDRDGFAELVENLANGGGAEDEDMTAEEKRDEEMALLSERTAGKSAEDRKRAKDSRRAARDAKRRGGASDTSLARRLRDAALARDAATDEALSRRFPGLHRIGNAG